MTEWESSNKMTETDKGNRKISFSLASVEVRQKIRAFSRKISTMERKDINSDIIKKMITFFLGFLFISYSIQIFVHLFSLLYPSFQTIKALQVWHIYFQFWRITFDILLNCRMKVKVERVGGSDTGLSSASSPCQSRCCFPWPGCSPCTPSSRRSSYSGAWPQSSQTERIQCITLSTLFIEIGKVNKEYLVNSLNRCVRSALLRHCFITRRTCS